VSSYLTFSPLPDPAGDPQAIGGVFSVALSVAQLAPHAQVLPGSLSTEPGLSSRRTTLYAWSLARDRPVGDVREKYNGMRMRTQMDNCKSDLDLQAYVTYADWLVTHW
jgi:hypothetical protein